MFFSQCHSPSSGLPSQPTSSSNVNNVQTPFNFPSSFITSPNFPPHSIPGPHHHFSYASSITPFPLIPTNSEPPTTFPFNLSPITQLNNATSNTEPAYIDHDDLLQAQQTPKEISSPSSIPISPSPQNSSEKRPRSLKRPVPEDQKDERYKMKRAKNNEAAKRSRDCKRMKEFESEKKLLETSEELSRLSEQLMKLEERCQLMKMDLNTRLGISFNNHNY